MNLNKFVNMKISDISIETMKIIPFEIQTYDIANLHLSFPIDELITVIAYTHNTDIGDFQSCKKLSFTEIRKQLNYVKVPAVYIRELRPSQFTSKCGNIKSISLRVRK